MDGWMGREMQVKVERLDGWIVEVIIW